MVNRALICALLVNSSEFLIYVLICRCAACALFAVVFLRSFCCVVRFNCLRIYLRIACAFLVLFCPAIESNFYYIKFHVNGHLSGGCRLVSDSLSLVLGLSII